MDIIHQLDVCYLIFIVEHIFSYLDLRSRMQLQLVCKTWDKIFHSIQLRQIMKLRQQNEIALFSNFAVYKRMHLSHENHWLDNEHVRCIAMNDHWMVAGCQSGRIPVWKRWTLRRHLILSTRNNKPVTSLYIGERVLIVGFNGGHVLIWDVKTFQLLQRIVNEDSDLYDNVTVLCNGRHVITFLRVSVKWKTLRGCLHIYDMIDESTVETKPKKTIHFYNEIIYRLFFDERYLVYVYQRIGARGCEMNIHSASDFQLLQLESNPSRKEESIGLFDYCNGWIAGQSADQQTVHLWNIDTGHHQVIRHAGDIIYSFSCNSKGQILTKSLDACRLWQMSRCSSQLKLLFSLQGNYQMEQSRKFDLFDERQFVSVRNGSGRVSHLAVIKLNNN